MNFDIILETVENVNHINIADIKLKYMLIFADISNGEVDYKLYSEDEIKDLLNDKKIIYKTGNPYKIIKIDGKEEQK